MKAHVSVCFLFLLILFLSKNKRTGNYGRTGHSGIRVTLCLGSRQCTLLGRTGATLMIPFSFFLVGGGGGGGGEAVYCLHSPSCCLVFNIQAYVRFQILELLWDFFFSCLDSPGRF